MSLLIRLEFLFQVKHAKCPSCKKNKITATPTTTTTADKSNVSLTIYSSTKYTDAVVLGCVAFGSNCF